MLRFATPTVALFINSSTSTRCYTTVKSLSKPLNIFVCAADEASDSAGAALVASLKQLHKQGVQLYGVGGPLLQAQGLLSVVSDEQYHHLATAEVVQQAYGLHKLQGISQASRHEYLKIFKNSIWEAALHGCGSRNITANATPASQQQHSQPQQRQQNVQKPATALIGEVQLPASLMYDAVLTIGSPTASQQVLFILRKAEEQKKARLPVVVHYMVPGLWDYQQVAAATAAWAKLTDHVMCSLPFEPQLLHKAGGPASFVGHPVVEPLLQQRSFGSRKALVQQLLQQKAVAAAETSKVAIGLAAKEQEPLFGQLFATGDAAAFWRVFDNLHIAQHRASREEGNSDGSNNGSTSGETATQPSTSSCTSSGSSRNRSRTAATAAADSTPGQQQHGRLLLCLLPGSTEAEVRSSMPAYDDITKALLDKYPHLVAAMILPDLLVEAGIQATNNYSLPVVVLPSGSVHSTHALAAAAAALSHPGQESLRATAAGVPMVCVRNGSLLRDGFSRWRRSQLLPFGSIPNLVLGAEVVPEVNLWERGGRETAVAAVARLLAGTEQQKAAGSSAYVEIAQQRTALQDVLLKLVPHQQQQATGAHVTDNAKSSSTVAAAGVPRVTVQAPSDAAAATLLELIALRKQQEAEQLQAVLAGSKQ